jgi:hypothetical protein
MQKGQDKEINKSEKKNKEREIHQSKTEKILRIKAPPDVTRPAKILGEDPAVPDPAVPPTPEEPQTPKEPCPNEKEPPGVPAQPPIVGMKNTFMRAYLKTFMRIHGCIA